ncbi:MAG: hypothetical protein WAL71_18725 [Terriglobales bacterium]
MATPDFEYMALSFLMCAPSDLNRAWTKANADPKEIKESIKNLGFSELVAARATQLLENMDKTSARMFFGAVATTLTKMNPEYAGPGVHPPLDDACKIVEAMKTLDSIRLGKSA